MSNAITAPVIALDSDGEDFALDFGFPAVSTARPAVIVPEIDGLEAKLARELDEAQFRRDWYAAKGLLPG